MNIAAAYKSPASSSTKLLLVLLIVVTAALAQDSAPSAPPQPNLQEPEYINSFFLLDADGSLKPLEHQTAGMHHKIKALGYGGGEMSYTVQSNHSPVRIAAGTPIAIIVKLENHDADPANLVELFTLKVGKSDRELVVAKHHFLGSTKMGAQDKEVALEFAKYGQSSVKITTSAPLPPGEYAMGISAGAMGSRQAYCFGVDAASK